MKTLPLILSLILTTSLIAQKPVYKYKLRLDNQPSTFSAMPDSSSSEKSLKLYVTDFINRPLPFCTVLMVTHGRNITYTTDASGYLLLNPNADIYKLVISSPSYTMIEVNPPTHFKPIAQIIKVTLTLNMSSKSCKIVSNKKLEANEIKEIEKKFSTNPYDTEISGSKIYSVICDL